jgi:hypothetical protein
MKAAGSTLSKIPNQIGATDWQGLPYNPVKSGQGTAYEGGQIAGNIAPWLIPGPHTATIPARLAASTGAGYLFNPEDNLQGAAEGLGAGLIGEALGPTAKILGETGKYLGGKITRIPEMEKALGALKGNYNESKEKALNYLRPVLKEFGTEYLPEFEQLRINEIYGQMKDMLSPKTKKLYQEFEKNPTFQNAFGLQSQAGHTTRQNKAGGVVTEYEKQASQILKDQTLESMENFLKNPPIENKQFRIGESPIDELSPWDAFSKFRKVYAQDVSPYLNEKSLRDIAQGKTHGMTPKKLDSLLAKSSEGEKAILNPSHFAAQVGEEFGGKLQKSKAYQDAMTVLSSLLGTGAGAIGGGTLGATLGGIAGYGASRVAQPAYDLLMNPKSAEIISKYLAPTYRTGRNAAVGQYNAPPEPVEIELYGE